MFLTEDGPGEVHHAAGALTITKEDCMYPAL